MSLIITGGGGTTFILYTLKTSYKIFRIRLFYKLDTKFFTINPHYFGECPLDFHLQNTPKELYFALGGGYLGEYISTSLNIEKEIQALCKNLSRENQIWLLRQIYREKIAFESKKYTTNKLTPAEFNELKRIYEEFFPNIFKLSENLYFYNGYFFPSNFCEISVMWHKHSLDILEPQTLAKMRQKDFIDVGACIGDSAVLFEREFCDKIVYAFEPTKKNFELMQRSVNLNNAKRIVPVNLGLGARVGELIIHYNADNIGGSSALWGETQTAETTKITTLDSFVRENKIEVGFIKVDIEGFEMEFLKGAKETIMQQKPAMLISIYHQPSDYFGIKPLIESWNLGYKFKIHKGVDFSIAGETALYCEILE